MGKTDILIQSMKFHYFKAFRSNEIFFNPDETFIFGANESGKTTITDGFFWCLFGRNAIGQSDTNFGIKTTVDGVVIPKVDHSVEVVLVVNQEEFVLKRVLKEIWRKPKGSEVSVFQGNKTDYFWNNVPLTQKEYIAKIAGILDEHVFSLITDPLAFSSMHWKKQRDVLIAIVGEESDVDLASGHERFSKLLDKLQNRSLKEYQNELAAERKRLNDEIQFLPSRIDEVYKSRPEEVDFEAVKKAKSDLQKDLGEVESQIQDRNKAHESEINKRTQINNRIYELKSENSKIEYEIKNEVEAQRNNQKQPLNSIDQLLSELTQKRDHAKRLSASYSEEIKLSKEKLARAEKSLDQLSNRWDQESKRVFVFDEDTAVCPTCNRKLEANNIADEKSKMEADFNADKKRAIDAINAEGIALKESKEKIDEHLKSLHIKHEEVESQYVNLIKEIESESKKYDALKKELDSTQTISVEDLIEQRLEAHDQYKSNLKEISTNQKALENRPGVNIDDLKERKSEIQSKIDGLNEILSTKDQIKKADERIEELKNSESVLAKKIAAIEKDQFVVEEFETKKIKSLEAKVNKLFKYVSFKMFSVLNDGSQNPYCEAIYKGIPWNDLNSAAKVQAGLDIINALSNHYEVSAPIFIDNRESVTDLIPTDSQIINLVVSPEDKKLRVK